MLVVVLWQVKYNRLARRLNADKFSSGAKFFFLLKALNYSIQFVLNLLYHVMMMILFAL